MSDISPIEASSRSVQIMTILKKADEAVKDDERIKPSDAWKYREAVRIKYGLPECGYLSQDPVRYIQTIEEFLKKYKVQIRAEHEFQPFFNAQPKAGAWATGPNVFRDNTVVVPQASESEWSDLITRAEYLAHESVHALQKIRYPNMPLEEVEREANYYQRFTPDLILRLQATPEFLADRLEVFELLIQESVKIDWELYPEGKIS